MDGISLRLNQRFVYKICYLVYDYYKSLSVKEKNHMDQTKIGTFIAKCRKEKKLTQAQLAEKLGITDRAVSKWETGKSIPDSSIMLELCEILGITVNELLSGEVITMENLEKTADENLVALKKRDENNMAKNILFAILYSLTLFIGIMVCLICDIAISGTLTWSLIPISSIAYAWAVSFPIIILGKRGIFTGLLSLTVFTVPYLFVLSRLTGVTGVLSIGTAMAFVSILFLWIIAVLCKRIGKTGKFSAAGFTFLAAIPFVFAINAALAKMIATPFLDIWDGLTIFILLILAFGCFVCAHTKKKGLLK